MISKLDLTGMLVERFAKIKGVKHPLHMSGFSSDEEPKQKKLETS